MLLDEVDTSEACRASLPDMLKVLCSRYSYGRELSAKTLEAMQQLQHLVTAPGVSQSVLQVFDIAEMREARAERR